MLSFDSSLYNLVREAGSSWRKRCRARISRTNLEAKINFG